MRNHDEDFASYYFRLHGSSGLSHLWATVSADLLFSVNVDIYYASDAHHTM